MRRRSVVAIGLGLMLSGCFSARVAQYHAECAQGDIATCNAPELASWCEHGSASACSEYDHIHGTSQNATAALPNMAVYMVAVGRALAH